MSTCQSRFVSPAAANAKATEPSPLSSQPMVRSPPLAAAVLDVMPDVPFHEPSPRPVMMAVTMSAAESPEETVMNPLPTSVSPPAFGTSPLTVVWA